MLSQRFKLTIADIDEFFFSIPRHAVHAGKNYAIHEVLHGVVHTYFKTSSSFWYISSAGQENRQFFLQYVSSSPWLVAYYLGTRNYSEKWIEGKC